MVTTNPAAKVGAIRAALKTRLATIPASTVTTPVQQVTALDWPADTQALPYPCWTIGIPQHRYDQPELFGEMGQYTTCRFLWEMRWPITFYALLVNSHDSTYLTDEQAGQLVIAIQSDQTLGGECVSAVVTDIAHSLNSTADQQRLHVVSAQVVTVSEIPNQ